MANDVTIPANGAIIATDEVGSVNYQIMKLDVGPPGTSVPVQNGVPIQPAPQLSVPGSVTSASILFSQILNNYSYVSYHHTSPGVNSVCQFQASNDNSHWEAIALNFSGDPTAVPSSTISSQGLYIGNVPYGYFRVVCLVYGSGTVAGVAIFSSLPSVPSTIGSIVTFNPSAHAEMSRASFATSIRSNIKSS